MSRKPISARLRFQVLERDGFACQCCGAKAPNATLHVDHIKPVAAGGSNEPENLQTLCVTCNVGKADMHGNVVQLRPATSGPIMRTEGLPEVKVRGDKLKEPILWIGLQWAVTAYGIEARDGLYCIEAERLWQDEESYGWVKHMRDKDWVDIQDFKEALAFAREHFAHLKPRASHG